MGVHDREAERKAKEAYGIPVDEPIFVLRAQDTLYPAILSVYASLYGAAASTVRLLAEGENYAGPHASEFAFMEHVDACVDNGRIWQRRNWDKVKVPD